MSKNDAAPRIVRKKVVAGDGHHGGAWKVAIFEGSNFVAFQRRFSHCRFGKDRYSDRCGHHFGSAPPQTRAQCETARQVLKRREAMLQI